MKPLFALTLLSVLAGCNTVEGIGQDLAAGGQAIEGAADDARPAQQQQQPVYQPVPQQQPIYRQQPVPTYNPPVVQSPNGTIF